MSAYERLLRPLMFRFNPETIHELAMFAISHGFMSFPRFEDPRLEQTLFGVKFPNPVGLAAGFDKDGTALKHLRKLGFGYVEIGTVTRHAQPGNPKPRLFRLPEHKAIINRMGFNNHGADAMARTIDGVRAGIPVGINLGKSKVTPLEEAQDDYGYSFQLLREYGDYFVVNVSSPNTPGLRSLQDKEPLSRIFGALKEIDADKPLFVKVAPDLEDAQLDDVIAVASEFCLTGIIATNTTISRSVLPSDPGIEGGLSGAPLKELATRKFEYLAKNIPTSLTLMGVGGITSATEAAERMKLGAKLVQLYTGWIYGGPTMIPSLLRDLAPLLDCKS